MTNIELLRSYRIFDLALFDLILSYAGVYLLAPWLIKLLNKVHIKTTRSWWLWMTLPLSVAIHILVGQETALTKMFLDPNGFILVKILIIAMIYMAFKKSK